MQVLREQLTNSSGLRDIRPSAQLGASRPRQGRLLSPVLNRWNSLGLHNVVGHNGSVTLPSIEALLEVGDNIEEAKYPPTAESVRVTSGVLV